MNGYEEAKWSRFCSRLLSFIDGYYSPFIKTDYEVKLDMTMEEITKELQASHSMADLSPQLRRVAMDCEEALRDGRVPWL